MLKTALYYKNYKSSLDSSWVFLTKVRKVAIKKKKISWILQPRNPVRILKVICHGSPQLGIGVPLELGKDSAVTSRNTHRGILNLECILQLLSKGFYAEKQVFQL